MGLCYGGIALRTMAALVGAYRFLPARDASQVARGSLIVTGLTLTPCIRGLTERVRCPPRTGH